jgi:hypothetical protein
MRTGANLFSLLNEFIVFLLGALMILLAVTRTMAVPSRPAVLAVLGVVFIFWATRAWSGPASAGRLEAGVRAASLAIVGILLIAIPLLSLAHANVLLGIAGGALAVRGVVGAALSLRAA